MVKGFLNKLFIPRPSVRTVNKKENVLVLPYFGKYLKSLRSVRSLCNYLCYINKLQL